MPRKSDIINALSHIKNHEYVRLEVVIGESFNFTDCNIRTFRNDDDGDWRLRVEADTDQSIVGS